MPVQASTESSRDPAPPVDALSEQLHALSRRLGSPHCCLLMQRAKATAFDDALERARQAAGIEVVPVPLKPLPESVWPYLLRLNLDQGTHAAVSALAMRQAWLDVGLKALREGRGHSVYAWMFGDTAPSTLARLVASHALPRHPRTRKRKWLRYYDPLVTDLYWSLLTSQQRQSMLRGVRAWAYVDRWCSLQGMESGPGQNADRTAPPTTEQWDRLQHVGALNQAWTRGRLEGRNIETSDLRQTFEALTSVKAHGLRERADIDLFAWHSLRYGPDFHHDTRVRRVLGQVDADEGYAYLSQALTDQDWLDIDHHRQRPSPSAERQETGHG